MRTLQKSSRLFLLLLILAWSVGCEESPEEQYKRIEQAELASGVRYDSLFKGIHFNMKKKDFLDYCFNMNLKDEFRQGGVKNGRWVECKLKNEMKYPGAINFFPKFKNNVITEMEAAIYYDNASYQDKVFESDSLLLDVLHLLEKWYGPGFMKIESPYFYRDDVFVKVNGNRRITVFKDISGHMINIWYMDLLAKKEEDENNE